MRVHIYMCTCAEKLAEWKFQNSYTLFDGMWYNIDKLKERSLTMAASEKFTIYIGTFDPKDNTFSWKPDKSYNSFDEAYKAFKNLLSKCSTYSYEEMKEVYGSPRLDVELRRGSKNLKWFGIYEKDFNEKDVDKN